MSEMTRPGQKWEINAESKHWHALVDAGFDQLVETAREHGCIVLCVVAIKAAAEGGLSLVFPQQVVQGQTMELRAEMCEDVAAAFTEYARRCRQ